MKLKLSTKLILIGIVMIAAGFRLFNLNWDQGHHLHPDERAIIMKVVQLQIPTTHQGKILHGTRSDQPQYH